VLRAVDGRLQSLQSSGLSKGRYVDFGRGNAWFFELGSDVSDYRGLAKAGESLQLLPSAALEKMITNAAGRSEPDYRIWGRVTIYNNANFIYPIYFLPLRKVEAAESGAEQPPPGQDDAGPAANSDEPQVSDSNDILAIPQEVLEKLQTKPTARPGEFPGSETPRLEPESDAQRQLRVDSILADRTAVLVKGDWRFGSFELDALGRNVQATMLRLLPCQALELTQARQAGQAERLRFRIAGIVTEYKGHRYMLPQRATRIYSFGNFPR